MKNTTNFWSFVDHHPVIVIMCVTIIAKTAIRLKKIESKIKLYETDY